MKATYALFRPPYTHRSATRLPPIHRGQEHDCLCEERLRPSHGLGHRFSFRPVDRGNVPRAGPARVPATRSGEEMEGRGLECVLHGGSGLTDHAIFMDESPS